jgi:hypothetical protein
MIVLIAVAIVTIVFRAHDSINSRCDQESSMSKHDKRPKPTIMTGGSFPGNRHSARTLFLRKSGCLDSEIQTLSMSSFDVGIPDGLSITSKPCAQVISVYLNPAGVDAIRYSGFIRFAHISRYCRKPDSVATPRSVPDARPYSEVFSFFIAWHSFGQSPVHITQSRTNSEWGGGWIKYWVI